MSKASNSSLKQEEPLGNVPGWLELGVRIQEAGLSLRQEITAELRKNGLGENTWRILFYLTWTRGPVRQCDLVKFLGTDKLSLGNLLHESEASGLILRDYDVHDRRVKLIELTPEGRRLAKQVEAG